MFLDPDTDLVTLLCTAVDVENVFGNKKQLADLVEEVLHTQPHLEVTRDDDRVVARTRLGHARRALTIGHLDTAPMAGNLPSVVKETPEGIAAHGRGTVDMKGGVAVALKLACELDRPYFGIAWVFYSHEEVDAPLNDLGQLVDNRPDPPGGDFAALMEPAGVRVEGGYRGIIHIRITAEGRVTHSVHAWMGDNTIHGLVDVLTRLVTYEPKRIEVDGLEYWGELNTVRIGGGMADNIIPPGAQVETSYQFTPDKSSDEALGYLEEVSDGYTSEAVDLSPMVRPGLNRPSVQEFVDAVGGKAFPKCG